MTDTTSPSSPARTLDAAGLAEAMASDHPPRLLDVRTPAEFENAHIPGSWLVPLDTLQEHRDDLARHLEEETVIICRSGNRAGQAERALAGSGLRVRVLSGGMLAWESLDGAEVRRGRETWELERQVRLVAGTLVAIGALGSLLVPGLVFLAAFVGLGLTFAALTNTCAMGMVLARMPWNRGAEEPDIAQVLEELASSR
ncbi:rhodanese-like domain-containing protein [Nocardioidaceae bacterium]|nr:rhodanese-like domain-containing protein [Nocardioidaceae bacterium]